MALEILSKLTPLNMGPVKMQFTSQGKAKMKRLKNVPTLNESQNLFHAYAKADALRLIRNFHEGIKRDSFGLEQLADKTVKRKYSLGMQFPEVPLYGRGDEKKKNSYVNMLRLKKLKKGYKVAPSWGRHHTSKLSLRSLFLIHEFGTIIQRGETLIRIPARPALFESYKKTVQETRRLKRSPAVKRIMTKYINEGKTAHFNKEIDRITKGLAKYEVTD